MLIKTKQYKCSTVIHIIWVLLYSLYKQVMTNTTQRSQIQMAQSLFTRFCFSIKIYFPYGEFHYKGKTRSFYLYSRNPYAGKKWASILGWASVRKLQELSRFCWNFITSPKYPKGWYFCGVVELSYLSHPQTICHHQSQLNSQKWNLVPQIWVNFCISIIFNKKVI